MKILCRGGILGKENELWRNISEHCLAEAVAADILGEALGADREKLSGATLLHDWYKRHEVEAMKKFGAATGHKKTLEEDEKALEALDVPKDIARLAHSNIPESIDRPYLDQRPLEEKILHYADLILIGSGIVDYEKRLAAARKDPRVVEFCDSYKTRYNGLSLLDVQQKLASEEQECFEKQLCLAPGTLINFIEDRLAERISKEG